MKWLWVFLLLFSACSSSSKKDAAYRKNANEDLAEVKENDKAIEMLSFERGSEVKYRADKDEYRGADSKDSVTAKESLQGLASLRVEGLLSKNEDHLSKIAASCYQQKYDEALRIADEAYAQYKANPSYWNQLGSCYLLSGDFSKANLFYNRAREIAPNYAPAVNNLAVMYDRLGRHQKAMATLLKANEISKFSVTPAYNLAQLYLRFGITAKALPLLQSLQKRSPDDVEVNSALASAYLLNGQTSESLALFEQLERSHLLRTQVGLNYVIALKMSKQDKEAAAFFAKIEKPSSAELKNYYQKVESLVRNVR